MRQLVTPSFPPGTSTPSQQQKPRRARTGRGWWGCRDQLNSPPSVANPCLRQEVHQFGPRKNISPIAALGSDSPRPNPILNWGRLTIVQARERGLFWFRPSRGIPDSSRTRIASHPVGFLRRASALSASRRSSSARAIDCRAWRSTYAARASRAVTDQVAYPEFLNRFRHSGYRNNSIA